MEIVGIILFCMFLLIGIAIIPFGIPGTFIIAGDALVYGLVTGFEKISVSFIVLFFGIAIAVEIVEAFLGAAMAKKFGGSKYGMIGAMVGALIGAILGTPVIPVLGTLLGGFLGAFLGAMIFDGLNSGDWENAWKVGLGAFFGAVGGKVTKILIAIIMAVMACIQIF